MTLSSIINNIILEAGFAERISKWLDRSSRINAIAELDPSKIYPENFRSAFGIPHSLADIILETAVRKGFFSKGVEVLCPDGVVAYSSVDELELPDHVICNVSDDGDYYEREFATKDLDKRTFYRLVEKASVTHA